MGFFNSERAVFKIQDIAGTTRDLSVYITSVDGLPGQVEMLDVTALGAVGRGFIPGLENVQFTIEGFQNTTGTLGPAYVLGSLRKVGPTGTPTAFELDPDGTASGEPKYTGSAWVRSFIIAPRVGNAVPFRAELQVQSTVIHATN